MEHLIKQKLDEKYQEYQEYKIQKMPSVNHSFVQTRIAGLLLNDERFTPSILKSIAAQDKSCTPHYSTLFDRNTRFILYKINLILLTKRSMKRNYGKVILKLKPRNINGEKKKEKRKRKMERRRQTSCPIKIS